MSTAFTGQRVPGGAFRYNTGGSSGEPLLFYYGRRRQASDAAGRIRARRWWGVEVGEREVYLWGAPVELGKTDRIKTLRDRLLNQLVLECVRDVRRRTWTRIWRRCRHSDRSCIYGYASSVALLAARARERELRLQLPELRRGLHDGRAPLPPSAHTDRAGVRRSRRQRIRQPRHRLHRPRIAAHGRSCL